MDTEAEHSDSEISKGDESDGSDDTYEKGSFIVSDAEESGAEDGVAALRAKQRKQEEDEQEDEIKAAMQALRKRKAKDDPPTTDGKEKAKKPKKDPSTVYKPQGNKSLDVKHVPLPPKAAAPVKRGGPKFHYTIRFTNARHAQSFWEVASKALPYLFFHIEVRDNYSGLRLEAHDYPATMAIKSVMECIIEEGVDETGAPVDRASLDGLHFCVNSKNLLKCFKCAQCKDTPLNLIKMHGKDSIIFEAVTNEEDVQTRYNLDFYAKSPSNILQRIPTTSDMQVKMNTHILQKLATIAATLNSQTLRFDLSEARKNADGPDVSRYKLTIYFAGSEIRGAHSFFLGAKRNTVKGVEEFEPVLLSADEQETLDWALVSSNSYSSNKFKLFVSNLDNEWCFIGISTDERAKPIVIVADSTETGSTSHTIFISPQQPEEDGVEA